MTKNYLLGHHSLLQIGTPLSAWKDPIGIYRGPKGRSPELIDRLIYFGENTRRTATGVLEAAKGASRAAGANRVKGAFCFFMVEGQPLPPRPPPLTCGTLGLQYFY